MSFEKIFLEVYKVLDEENITEFYSSDISNRIEIDSGNIGRALSHVIREYDLPLTYERETPADPLLFTLEEEIEFEEVKETLSFDERPENPEKALLEDAKQRIDAKTYSDYKLDNLLRECASQYYKRFCTQAEHAAKAKETLQDEGLIEGDRFEGWHVNTD